MNTKTKILIVDDNVQMRKLLQMSFRNCVNSEIFEAKDGVEAIKMVQEYQPDIVFLDIMMPNHVDGLDVCRFIKSSPLFQHIFVVFLSAKGQEKDIELGLAAGGDKYLTKPFSPKMLIDIVSEFRGFEC